MKKENKVMTVFYRKRDKFICAICTGTPSYSVLANGLDDIDAELVYGKIIVPYDNYIISNSHMFELDEDLNIVLLEEYKNNLKKYI